MMARNFSFGPSLTKIRTKHVFLPHNPSLFTRVISVFVENREREKLHCMVICAAVRDARAVSGAQPTQFSPRCAATPTASLNHSEIQNHRTTVIEQETETMSREAITRKIAMENRRLRQRCFLGVPHDVVKQQHAQDAVVGSAGAPRAACRSLRREDASLSCGVRCPPRRRVAALRGA